MCGTRLSSYSSAERALANHLSIIHNDTPDSECSTILNGRYCTGSVLHTCLGQIKESAFGGITAQAEYSASRTAWLEACHNRFSCGHHQSTRLPGLHGECGQHASSHRTHDPHSTDLTPSKEQILDRAVRPEVIAGITLHGGLNSVDGPLHRPTEVLCMRIAHRSPTEVRVHPQQFLLYIKKLLLFTCWGRRCLERCPGPGSGP
jgi:hypothetical protein